MDKAHVQDESTGATVRLWSTSSELVKGIDTHTSMERDMSLVLRNSKLRAQRRLSTPIPIVVGKRYFSV